MYSRHYSSIMGLKFTELQLTFNPEARLERLALLSALGYDKNNILVRIYKILSFTK